MSQDKKNQKEIEAIDENDLDALLSNLGLSDDFRNDNLKCHFCGDIIHKDNFGAIFSKEKKIFIVCDKLKCLANLS